MGTRGRQKHFKILCVEIILIIVRALRNQLMGAGIIPAAGRGGGGNPHIKLNSYI